MNQLERLVTRWSFSLEIFNIRYSRLGSNLYLLYFLRTGVAVLKRFFFFKVLHTEKTCVILFIHSSQCKQQLSMAEKRRRARFGALSITSCAVCNREERYKAEIINDDIR